MIKEQQLIEQKELRERLVNKVSILYKIKELLLLFNNDIATLKQVAEYYEVGEKAISSLVFDNKEELKTDGYIVVKGKEIRESHVISFKEFTSNRANYKFTLDNGEILSVGGKGIALFPRRAILRVGMLLRDSEIAKEVRTQLLNIEEKTTNEQKTEEINKEKLLFMNIMFAENESDRAIAVNELYKYNQRNKVKIEYHDAVLHADKLITTNDVAKDLGITDRKLYKILRENKILYKQGKIYKPYANYDFLLKENYADYHINEWSQTLKWYEKGRKWIISNIDKWNK
ncbi:hypothetical protein FDC62_07900 [Clostridium botulinum]|uniref:phage antirepressor KilAC domain-containing protein n=1 Tax=Clostridium botulinum TaxID=1491 RepID=UPI0009930EDE|nr:phage antirepressor KilAC domain-containing protein [Clostridium botulinum]NFO98130.1 hypothetical protein [Clostridium botulinum]OOV53126.1 hypothetical protein B1A66_00890 [Clostridium botulinum D/C]OOV58306.1 hypothetical protein B0673_02380 [Clostridium botulinum D/C]OOV59631.1 hypothetical protein B1A67_00935 [Clostridium botulinum D/C]OOV60307.1 hypothetical protein B1A69_12890 [Clostridium botulinum D/C]